MITVTMKTVKWSLLQTAAINHILDTETLNIWDIGISV